ncbi:hypothetical protein PHSY_005615 [Pseudozyma hubeiensis SY62]|uniref:Uncharacterized protein n=1 Tax=Pseudozyma hubeiensis (strain SY62) TaxID=1305764 RepID=R9P9U7_PSEHS|nr:hypothetical protein PHSY_005615 [Pseudozyma hubeiensis SY62]GAC98027.1 hypothetical protein PHSY_005615 [Pseudozyma hubeiensis SY62]
MVSRRKGDGRVETERSEDDAVSLSSIAQRGATAKVGHTRSKDKVTAEAARASFGCGGRNLAGCGLACHIQFDRICAAKQRVQHQYAPAAEAHSRGPNCGRRTVFPLRFFHADRRRTTRLWS